MEIRSSFKFDTEQFSDCFRIEFNNMFLGESILPRKMIVPELFSNGVQCGDNYIDALELVMLKHTKEIIAEKSRDEIEHLITKCTQQSKIEEQQNKSDNLSLAFLTLTDYHHGFGFLKESYCLIGVHIHKLTNMRIRLLRNVLKTM